MTVPAVTYSAAPEFRWDNHAGHFIVTASFDVLWQGGWAFTVREGFTTDFASIPRWALSLVGGKVGRHIQPSIVHDFTYEDKVPGMTRAEADLLFLEGMKSVGVPWMKRNIMWSAVRAAGWAVWG